jgi:hypothetical protein
MFYATLFLAFVLGMVAEKYTHFLDRFYQLTK